MEGAVARVGVVAALLRRPRLWPIAAVEVAALVPRGWWRRWPPIPSPDREYLRFRLQTQYGDPDHEPDGRDLVAWLEWCRDQRRFVR